MNDSSSHAEPKTDGIILSTHERTESQPATEHGSSANGHPRGTGSSRPANEDESRTIYKQRKIKITDLRAIHHEERQLKKQLQKEAARIFPKPLLSFAELRSRFNVNSSLAHNVAEQGFCEPTDVQLAALPISLDENIGGADLIVVAPTGSGKTLAFLIPLINKIVLEHHAEKRAQNRHVRAIVLAPTKELEDQIVNEGRKLTSRTGVTVSGMRKGMRLHRDQPSDMNEEDSDHLEWHQSHTKTMVKSDILVSTPQTLLNALREAKMPKITTLVIDEADVLLDPLFRDQTMSIWSACSNIHLQTSLWSATIGSNIESLALDKINQRHHDNNITPIPPLLRVVVGLKDSTLPHISHKLIYAATESGKFTGLRQLLHPPPSHDPTPRSKATTTRTLKPGAPFLIFTQTIPRAIALATELAYDIPTPSTSSSSTPNKQPLSRVAVLHSALTPTQRSETMSRFRLGSIWVLVTTDLLSRGVDFKGVNTVVNYDLPGTVAAYVHRAGRTGRADAGGATAREEGNNNNKKEKNKGQCCVTLYTKDDVPYLRPIALLIHRAALARGTRRPSASLSSPTSPPTSSATITTTTTAAGAGAPMGNTGRTTTAQDESEEEEDSGVPPWLLASLPHPNRNARQSLRRHGVVARLPVRKAVDDEGSVRGKRRNRIGTGMKMGGNRSGAVAVGGKGNGRGKGRGGHRGWGDDGGGGREEEGEEEWGGFD